MKARIVAAAAAAATLAGLVAAWEPPARVRDHRVEGARDDREAGGALPRTPPSLADLEGPDTDPASERRTAAVPQRARSRSAAPLDAHDALRRHTERVTALDVALSSEPLDATWADETQRMATRAAGLHEAAVEELECRSTFCRLILEHPGEGRRKLLDELRREPPFRGVSYAFFPPDRDVVAFYFAREGHTLPWPSEAAPIP